MKHSLQSISAAAGVSIVGNVAYLPTKPLTPQTLGRLGKHLGHQAWFKEVIAKLGFSPINGTKVSGFVNLEALASLMRAKNRVWVSDVEPFALLHESQEPEWMKKLPISAQRYLRYTYAITDGTDPLAIVHKFPYMGFGYVVPEGGMASEAVGVFKLFRLSGIKQLGFLHDPVLKETDRTAGAMMFDHNRYCHVLDTHAVANLIADRIGLKGTRLNTLLTAAISHDALTPAGGDTVKLVDPAAFDEDAHYPELLEGEGWESYRQQFGIDRELLTRTILGEGLLGRILDIADKTSYMARDIGAYLMTAVPTKSIVNTNLYAVTDIVQNDPHVCALWESISLRKGELVFGDKERLARFLKLRALMFRGLYYNPFSRFFEYLVGRGIVKYLYQKGTLTREQLLQGDDHWIEGVIDKALETQFFIRRFHNLEHARIEEYHDAASAQRRMRDFDRDPSSIVILDNFMGTTSNGIHKFSVNTRKGIVKFAHACPKAAEEIETVMTFSKVVRLYIFDAGDLHLSAESCRLMKKILRTVT